MKLTKKKRRTGAQPNGTTIVKRERAAVKERSSQSKSMPFTAIPLLQQDQIIPYPTAELGVDNYHKLPYIWTLQEIFSLSQKGFVNYC